jgi:hypothetical protein
LKTASPHVEVEDGGGLSIYELQNDFSDCDLVLAVGSIAAAATGGDVEAIVEFNRDEDGI